MESIIRRFNKKERKSIPVFKLAMVLTKDTERILIGTEENIKRRLEGQGDVDLLCDETRPFGTFLLSLDKVPDGDWCIVVAKLIEAQEIMHLRNLKKSALVPEGEAEDLLAEKYDSADPIYRYVAVCIWYGYWKYREERSSVNCDRHLEAMQNLIRPFSKSWNYVEEQEGILSANFLCHNTQELHTNDREQVIYYFGSKEGDECIFADVSLIPLERYYLSKIDKWKKYFVRCKICGRLFMADNLTFEICSDECRKQSHSNVVASRKQDEEVAEIDRILNNAGAHWYNRLTKMKNSVEYSEEEVKQFARKKDQFLKEKRKKRQAYKKGEISYVELRDWLLHQEAEAQAVLESIWLHKGDNEIKSK